MVCIVPITIIMAGYPSLFKVKGKEIIIRGAQELNS
jgi:hypothetical protein